MTQDEIIEMARQAGFFVKDGEAYSPSVQEDHELTPYLKAFAKLVRDEILQAITDPENQPSQFGTVTLEYHQEKMKQWEDLFERMSDKAIAQRTWVGLTDEEISACDPSEECWGLLKIARAIEAKLKEKNT